MDASFAAYVNTRFFGKPSQKRPLASKHSISWIWDFDSTGFGREIDPDDDQKDFSAVLAFMGLDLGDLSLARKLETHILRLDRAHSSQPLSRQGKRSPDRVSINRAMAT